MINKPDLRSGKINFICPNIAYLGIIRQETFMPENMLDKFKLAAQLHDMHRLTTAT